MKAERVLAIDLSSKTGWSLTISSDEGLSLEAYGQIPKIECPQEEPYPSSYVTWAYTIFGEIENLIDIYTPSVLVIEETCGGSKNAFSQKLLEYSHFLLARYIKETKIKNVYFQTGVWRKETGSYMNDAERKHNKEVKKYKEKHKTKIARDINTGKRIGKITKKHVTIRLVNEVFAKYLKMPLRKKDEDVSDSLGLAFCYHLRRKRGLHE